MSETENKESNDAREIVASIFEGAAATARTIATLIPDATIKGALAIGGAAANAIASLFRSIGTDQTGKLLEELQRRRNEGTISDAQLASDDNAIRQAVSDLYRE